MLLVPSASATLPKDANRDCPTCAVPVITGLPVAGLLAVAGVSVSLNATAAPADQLRPDLLQALCWAALTWASSKANVVPSTSSVKVWQRL